MMLCFPKKPLLSLHGISSWDAAPVARFWEMALPVFLVIFFTGTRLLYLTTDTSVLNTAS